MLVHIGPIVVVMEQSPTGARRVAAIAEVADVDQSLRLQSPELTPLWVEQDDLLVHTGHRTRHAARIREHGWASDDRAWI